MISYHRTRPLFYVPCTDNYYDYNVFETYTDRMIPNV